MDDFTQKIVLAFVALILGLLAESIKKIITRERKRVSYSISSKQIIGVDNSLPDALRSQIPIDWTGHLVHFHIRAENSGAQPLSAINVLCVSKDPSEVRHFEFTTNPPREVPVGEVSLPKSNEIRIPEISLERNQSLDIDIFVRSPMSPDMQIFWSGGGGNVDWRMTSANEAFGVERDVFAAIKYYIYAQMSVIVVTSVFIILSSFFGGRLLSGGVGLGQFIVIAHPWPEGRCGVM